MCDDFFPSPHTPPFVSTRYARWHPLARVRAFVFVFTVFLSHVRLIFRLVVFRETKIRNETAKGKTPKEVKEGNLESWYYDNSTFRRKGKNIRYPPTFPLGVNYSIAVNRLIRP